LLAIAIVDDLGAVLVIVMFCTNQIRLPALACHCAGNHYQGYFLPDPTEAEATFVLALISLVSRHLLLVARFSV
jgi:hypothetical protein